MAKKKHDDETVNQPEVQEEPVQEAPEAQEPQQDIALELARKCDEYLLMAQRTQADFENYKRRNETARAQAYADGMNDMLTAMLPVIDNFERAMESSNENTDAATLLKGIELVKKQLEAVFEAKKCEAIDSNKGTAFDPAVHNAIMTAPQEAGFEPGTIAATLQKGYRVGDKVIRYAMVSVFEQ